MNEIKVSINELISISAYSIIEAVVPPYEEIKQNFSSTWADMYLDEDLKEQEGKHCYIVYDDYDYSYRAIVVENSLTNKAKTQLLDIMDNVIFDLIYNDTLEQVTGDCSADSAYGIGFEQDYCKLLKYIQEHKEAQEKVSDYAYSWLLVLVQNRLDLLEL